MAAQMLGCRAILLGPGLPEIRTAGVLTLSYVPFSQVFPRAAAIVYHGGIGTTAIALRAGKPMLIVPSSFAQPDIAARLTRLGVARVIPRKLYRAGTAAAALWTLLSKSRSNRPTNCSGRRGAARRQCGRAHLRRIRETENRQSGPKCGTVYRREQRRLRGTRVGRNLPAFAEENADEISARIERAVDVTCTPPHGPCHYS
jgi:UDP:flavonoid glycosyltransferase YjiC (YdhE family)